jgi:hypothetical protein
MTMPEVGNLEEIWLQDIVPCILDQDCKNEATWALVVICPCCKTRYPSCDTCRQWFVAFLSSRNWTGKLRCKACTGVVELSWLPL